MRGLTPRDRLDRVLNLVAQELGDELAGFVKRIEPTVNVFDPYYCLKFLRDHAKATLTPSAAHAAKAWASELLGLRNKHAHGEKIDEKHARRGSALAVKLLQLFARQQAADVAADHALPPSIAYVAPLRRALIEAANSKRCITYEAALSALSLDQSDLSYRMLYRQLNVLAAKQMLLDEPMLCALVVSGDSNIPGDGFYWVLDVNYDAAPDTKREAHRSELARVFSFKW